MDTLRIFNLLLNFIIITFFVIGAYLQLQSDVRKFTKNDSINLGGDFKVAAGIMILASGISHSTWIPFLFIYLGCVIILWPEISMAIKEATYRASLGFSVILFISKLSRGAIEPEWHFLLSVALMPTVFLAILKLFLFAKGE